MAARCTVCASPHRYEIDAALVQGASRRGLADRYGLGRMSMNRHAEGHVPALMATVASAVERLSAGSLLAQTMDLYERTLKLCDEADSEDTRTRIAALEQVRRVTETLAKVAIAANTEANQVGAQSDEHRFDLDAAIMDTLGVAPAPVDKVRARVDAVLPALPAGVSPAPVERDAGAQS